MDGAFECEGTGLGMRPHVFVDESGWRQAAPPTSGIVLCHIQLGPAAPHLVEQPKTAASSRASNGPKNSSAS